MSPLAQAVSGALAQFVWQGFLGAFFVSVAMFLLRRASPRTRYAVCCASLAAMAALPVITAAALYDPYASNRPGPAAITLTIRAVWSGGVSSASAMERWLTAAQPWILPAWLAGVVFLSLRLAWMGRRVSALRRAGGPPDRLILAIANAMARRMGMRRAVRVLVSAVPEGPGVVGWIRPVILLPAATILNLTPDQLEAIVAHEIAHLRRYDDVVNLAQSVIETLLFYHPAVWWVSNRIRQERELCCGDLAVRASGNAICYARALTALERLRIAPAGLSIAALGNGGSSLEQRIGRIVDGAGREYRPSALPGLVALALALGCMAAYSSPARGWSPPPPAPVVYPERAREQGIQGTVPVQVQIDGLGSVKQAKAIGGPRELREAAVTSASTLRFAPEAAPATERVDVAFELTPPPPPPVPVAAPRPSRASIVRSLYAVLDAAPGKTDPAALEAGRKAGLQLLDRYGESLDSPSELHIHNTLGYIAAMTGDDEAAELEFRKVLEIDPDQAHASFLLGAAILRERSPDNELTRYSEAIYEYIRSLRVTGPAALSPEMKAVAENALRQIYESYHGSADGLAELMKRAGDSALPPADFHIASIGEMAAALPARYVAPPMMNATVVSQISANRILVRLDDEPAVSTTLRLDATNLNAIRPGTRLAFRGTLDSGAWIIEDPRTDLVILSAPKRRNVIARMFRGFFHALRHLA